MVFVSPQAGPSSLPWASPPEVNTAMALPTPRVLASWWSSWVMIHSRIQENGQLRHSWIKVLWAQGMALLDWLEPPQSGSPTTLSLSFAAWDLWTSSRRKPHPTEWQAEMSQKSSPRLQKSSLIPPTPIGAYLENELRSRRRVGDWTEMRKEKVKLASKIPPF